MKRELHEIHHRFWIIQCETRSCPVGGQECLVLSNISPQIFSCTATMFCTCPLKWIRAELGVDVAFYRVSATSFQLTLTLYWHFIQPILTYYFFSPVIIFHHHKPVKVNCNFRLHSNCHFGTGFGEISFSTTHTANVFAIYLFSSLQGHCILDCISNEALFGLCVFFYLVKDKKKKNSLPTSWWSWW